MIALVASATAQTLAVPPLVLGQDASLVVSGAPPGAQVAFAAGAALGAGPCLGPAPDDCLGIVAPRLLGVVTATPSGTATLRAVVPATAPLAPMHLQAVVAGPGVTLTPVVTAGVEPLSSLSDPFDGGALDPRWSVLHPDRATVAVAGGALTIAPVVAGPGTFWYQDGEGVLVHQEIRGDFEVTTRALARAAGAQGPPAVEYRLGGITVRNPDDTAPGTHDFLHLAVGAGDAAHPYAIEHKLTVDSVSAYAFLPAPYEAIDLRIARTGSRFDLSWKRAADVAFTPVVSHVVPQLPDRVQVGLMAYAARAPTDLEVDFEAFDLAP